MVTPHLRKIRDTSIRKSNAQFTPREFGPNHRRPIKRSRTTNTTKESNCITRAEGLSDHGSKAAVGISSPNGSSDPHGIFDTVEGDPPTKEDANEDARTSVEPHGIFQSVEGVRSTKEANADEDTRTSVEPRKITNNKRPAESVNAEDDSSYNGDSDLQEELKVAEMCGSDYGNANALQEPTPSRSDVVVNLTVGTANGAADVRETGIGENVLENVRPLDESTFNLRAMVFTTFVPPIQRLKTKFTYWKTIINGKTIRGDHQTDAFFLSDLQSLIQALIYPTLVKEKDITGLFICGIRKTVSTTMPAEKLISAWAGVILVNHYGFAEIGNQLKYFRNAWAGEPSCNDLLCSCGEPVRTTKGFDSIKEHLHTKHSIKNTLGHACYPCRLFFPDIASAQDHLSHCSSDLEDLAISLEVLSVCSPSLAAETKHDDEIEILRSWGGARTRW